jgi:hypothetical protein
MIAEFESDLIRMRTREGMKVAKAKGRLRGKQPKLKPLGSPEGGCWLFARLADDNFDFAAAPGLSGDAWET